MKKYTITLISKDWEAENEKEAIELFKNGWEHEILKDIITAQEQEMEEEN